MRFNPIDKLILFGGSYLMAELIRSRVELNGSELVVFSAARHLDEDLNGATLKHILDEQGVRYFESEDINTDPRLKNEVNPNTLGIALGAAWIFEKPTVQLFAENHLLDFMGIDLPRYRGGAHYTWQILHSNKKGCANLQVIFGGGETFHRGPIIKREEYQLPDAAKTPKDYFDFIVKKEAVFLREFLQALKRGQEFIPEPLDESQSSYYPPLHTKSHGLINWSWSGKDISLFINAFDEPYAGASTFVNSKKVFLKDCQLLPAQENYHPFTSGIVVRKNNQGLFVATVGNLLLIKKIVDESDSDLMREIELGARLYTPSAMLDETMSFRVDYDAKGLTHK